MVLIIQEIYSLLHDLESSYNHAELLVDHIHLQLLQYNINTKMLIKNNYDFI
jgi:hypothetical protein